MMVPPDAWHTGNRCAAHRPPAAGSRTAMLGLETAP